MKMRLGRRISVIELVSLFCLLLTVGCGGEQGAGGDESAAGASEEPAVPGGAGVTASVDAALAAQGEGLFRTRACIGCHTIGGGRLTGPDLQGVTERRTFDWIVAMVMNPDSMVKSDSIAKALFAEYMTPMLPAKVTQEEAAAIYEFLRREGSG
jgi:mono/diheme cytochrome c family protein